MRKQRTTSAPADIHWTFFEAVAVLKTDSISKHTSAENTEPDKSASSEVDPKVRPEES